MAYVSVPKDLKKVKNKVAFNLTSRQIICFSLAAAVGVPIYLLTKSVLGSSIASMLMILIMLPFFAVAMYERDGQPLEKVLRNIVETCFIWPKERPYKTENSYAAISQENKINQIMVDKKLTPNEKKRLVNAVKKAKRDGKIPDSAQRTIAYKNMYKDGICQVTDKFYTKTIQFFDINYLLAQKEDQSAIFEKYCEFLNYFSSSVSFQLSFINLSTDIDEFQKLIQIPKQKDSANNIRKEYSGILNDQFTKGNNGLAKTKYITFGIEADNPKDAKSKIDRIENDILNNFKTLGVMAKTLNGYERLNLLHGIFHDSKEKFRFHWDSIYKTGLSTKDFIAPTSFEFRGTYFRMGRKFGAASYIMIDATELSDRMLSDILDTEENIIVSLCIQPNDQVKAIKYLKNKLSDIEKMKIEEQKKALRAGYDPDIMPSDLITYGNEAKMFLENLQMRNERMFMVTVLLVHTADTKQKLEASVAKTQGVIQQHNCVLRRLDFQQEKALTSSLPIGMNRIEIDCALHTSSTAAFVPFTTQELFMSGESLYYGLNAVSNNMIMADRKRLKTPNGLILGTPGSGKSFAAKREMTNAFLATKDDIIICDPEDEYFSVVKELNGQVINVAATSKQYVNPMDINLNYSEDDSPLALKSDFILSLCELMKERSLSGKEKSIIDRCIRYVYRKYLSDPRPENMPILADLYDMLLEVKTPESEDIASLMEIYVTGSLNVFNHRTNVDINNRLVCFNIKELGNQLKKIGMLIVQDQVWNRVTLNRAEKKSTRYYMDEFHLLLKDVQTANYSVEIWKRFRKWGGIPTGITQNVTDFLSSPEIENILKNSDFVYLLNQSSGDREILAAKLGISEDQLNYVKNTPPGEGLLVYDSIIIPFVDKFPKDTQLYSIMTTKLEEVQQERTEVGVHIQKS